MNAWYHHLLLSLLSGLLLTFSWPADGFPFLAFVAFIPLLYVAYSIRNSYTKRRRMRFFSHAYLTFFVWNLLITYWIFFSSPEGAYVAILFNSLFMAFVWLLFFYTQQALGKRIGYIGLLVYWIAFEYLHLDWDLSWPWLMLGNVFANRVEIIQWYEITGSMGGTLWVLLVNIMLFEWIILWREKNQTIRGAIPPVALLVLPIMYSLIRYYTYKEEENPVTVVLVQPNIDPWDKFGGIPATKQFDHIISLALSRADSLTDYIITPETSVFSNGVWDHELMQTPEYNRIKEITNHWPRIHFIMGISHLQLFEPGPYVPLTAEKFRNKDLYYDDHNSALQIDNHQDFQIYHKSKLVPGPEMMPFAEVLKPIQHKLFGKLGGQIGDMGTQKERTVFFNTVKKINVAPVICYESIYGGFITQYIRNGASFISVSTNDAWWGDSPGYRQLLAYTRLRAIETRRSIARSANTGISCFINQRGDVIQPSKFWTTDVIKGTVNLNHTLTLYTRHGDFVGRISLLVSFLLLFYAFVRSYLNKRNA
ncbi:MAG: apolipoprotein N-acyltransferase [Candidatus Competibacteraceae bacterium]|nr:apolipoprotein N-acyltransferase [Candidatus Competibacteraceae bacterium]